MTASRLKQLADDCEERARLSRNADARGLYHLAATQARMREAGRHWSDLDRRDATDALSALVKAARWLDGECITDILSEGKSHSMADLRSYSGSLPSLSNFPLTQSPSPAPPVPSSAFNARQLAERFSVPERTARYRIEQAVRRGRAGFYRDGCRWYAEPLAFAEFLPNRSRGLGQANDSADHSPPIEEDRPEAA